MRTVAGSDNKMAEALLVGADFVLGAIEIRVAAEFLSSRR
jgi:hypothetical protein